MLVKCYECGCEISDMAKTCPHCGAPMRRIDGAELGRKMSAAVHSSVLPTIKKVFLAILPLLILGASVFIICAIANTYPMIKLYWANALIVCTHCLLGGLAFLAAVKKVWGLRPFKLFGWIDFIISYVATLAVISQIAVNMLSLGAFVLTLTFGVIPLYLMYKYVSDTRESKSSTLGWLIVVLTIILSLFILIGTNQAANDRILMRTFRSEAKRSPRECVRACKSGRNHISGLVAKESKLMLTGDMPTLTDALMREKADADYRRNLDRNLFMFLRSYEARDEEKAFKALDEYTEKRWGVQAVRGNCWNPDRKPFTNARSYADALVGIMHRGYSAVATPEYKAWMKAKSSGDRNAMIKAAGIDITKVDMAYQTVPVGIHGAASMNMAVPSVMQKTDVEIDDELMIYGAKIEGENFVGSFLAVGHDFTSTEKEMVYAALKCGDGLPAEYEADFAYLVRNDPEKANRVLFCINCARRH